MSIVEEPRIALDPRQIRWGGYGLMVVSLVVAIAALFELSPLLAAADIVLAVACVGVTLWTPELFEVTGRGKSRGLNPLFLAPAALVFWAGVTNAFVSFNPLLISAAIGAVPLAAAGVFRGRRPGVAKPTQYVILLGLVGATLGYGAPALVDVRFDTSPGQPFRATVESMYVNQGRSWSYHLRLGAWGPVAAGSVEVPRSLYDQFNPGDQACIDLHPGALAIPWFSVRACPGPS
jgi:hypothetical protein